jgi:hypothetical protein
MRPGRLKHGQVVIGGLLEQAAEVVTVSLQGPTAVGGQERRRRQLGLMAGVPGQPRAVTRRAFK